MPGVVSMLIRPSNASLPPQTVAVCIQAAVKVFGSWIAGLAAYWDESEKLQQVLNTLAELESRLLAIMKEVDDVEICERVMLS